MKLLLILCLVFFALTTFANQESFYPADFESQIKGGTLKEMPLRKYLLDLVSKDHHALGYDKARQVLFGKLYLEQNGQGYFLRDTYCHKEFTGPNIGPMKIPDHNLINVEHTWPQSKYGARDDKYKVCDLHHLFIADNVGNKSRANNPLGDVVGGTYAAADCQISKVGKSATAPLVFEPPQEHKGNAARAMFYFAVRYKLAIDPAQEATLRRWNKDDPVDPKEKENNDIIEEFQGNRNPFIDYPELIDLISDL